MTDWIELMLGEDEEEAEDEERPALDGTAELRPPGPPRPEAVDEAEGKPAPEGRTDGPADAGGTAYRPGAGEPAHRRPWDEGTENPGPLPQALAAAAREAGGMKPAPGAAGYAGRTADGISGGETGAGAAEGPLRRTAEVEQAGDRGLAELYRQTARAIRPAASAAAPARIGLRAPEREDGAPPPLTAEELDRAVRRDSRRYDGGMTIY